VSIPLDELRDVQVADVRKQGVVAATLTRTPQGVVFAYEPTYDGAAVATTLPRPSESLLTPAGALPAFFTGLLPEGRRLTWLRRAVKTSADDDLTLLLAVGSNLVGDVQVTPRGVPPDPSEALRVASWGDVRFGELMRDEFESNPDRSGLAGVQDKVSAAMISLPVRRQHESYILKLDPPEFGHLVMNEFTMLGAAQKAGIKNVAHADLVRDRDGLPGLLVRRFDRVPSGRLAVEDGCQVTNRYPADKYSLRTEDVCAALARLCDAPLVAARTLLQLVGFAYLSCNGDLHAKNLSIVELEPGRWRIAPAYDVPSSYPYGDHTMALSINGKRRDDIGRRDFLELGAALELPERATSGVLDALAASVDRWIDDLDAVPFGERVVRKWKRAVQYRRRRLAGRNGE
jgi:serine/threonine-protein kinase HipA